MTRRSRPIPIDAVLVEDGPVFTMREVCEACGVHAERVIEIVDYGVVDAPTGRSSQWRFSASSVYRIRRAIRLCDDLELNPAGALLAVELLDELDRLRRKVKRLSSTSPDD